MASGTTDLREVFTMEDGTQRKIGDLQSVAGARAITVKDTYKGKPINILVDTGCDIVCVTTRLIPPEERKC
jgi:hypothetical protein